MLLYFRVRISTVVEIFRLSFRRPFRRLRHFPSRQEKAWLVYVGLLLISVFYRFAQSIGFSGDPIALKPGTPNGNDVTKRSGTHHIKMMS